MHKFSGILHEENTMKDVSVKYTKTGVPFVIVDDFFNGFESEQLLAELDPRCITLLDSSMIQIFFLR